MKVGWAGVVEQPLGEAVRGCPYYDAVRPSLGLQPRGKIWRLANDIDLRGLALADRLADQDLPCGDPDAHAKHDVAVRAQARDVAHDFKGGANSALGIVLVRLRVAKVCEDAVAAKPRNLAAILSDRGDTAGLIGTKKNAHFLRVQPRRKFRRCCQIRK